MLYPKYNQHRIQDKKMEVDRTCTQKERRKKRKKERKEERRKTLNDDLEMDTGSEQPKELEKEHCHVMVRYVCRNHHTTSSVASMHEELNSPSLQRRRCNFRLKIFYKVTNKLVSLPTKTLRCTRQANHKRCFLHVQNKAIANIASSQ